MFEEVVNTFKECSERLHGCFLKNGDATIELINSMAGNTTARKVPELSLSPLFSRGHSSLYKVVANFFNASTPENAPQERIEHQKKLMGFAGATIPAPQHQSSRRLALDTTTVRRAFADTLEDKGVQHYPNPAPGNKPITVGHSFSALVGLPEKADSHAPPWVVPLSIRRVPTCERATDIGAQQIKALMEIDSLPFGKELVVLVADSAYSAVTFLHQMVAYSKLVTIVRVSGQRVFYRRPGDTKPSGRGHPRWYGARFALKEPNTWGPPNSVATTSFTTKKGRKLVVRLEGWSHVLMRGKGGCPMHEQPFTLIRVLITDEEGNLVFKRPMWLTVHGERRNGLSLVDAWEAYGQRYDIEHFFRFAKNRLLMTDYQTPEVEHEENWLELVGLAYVQLWLASPLAKALPRPWERPVLPTTDIPLPLNPSGAQRDFARIVQQVGTPAAPPKPRGKSPGRQKGQSPGRRPRCPVVKKGKKPRPDQPP